MLTMARYGWALCDEEFTEQICAHTCEDAKQWLFYTHETFNQGPLFFSEKKASLTCMVMYGYKTKLVFFLLY